MHTRSAATAAALLMLLGACSGDSPVQTPRETEAPPAAQTSANPDASATSEPDTEPAATSEPPTQDVETESSTPPTASPESAAAEEPDEPAQPQDWPPSPAVAPAQMPIDVPLGVDECVDIGLFFWPYIADTGDVAGVMATHFAGSAWGELDFALNEMAAEAEPGHTSPGSTVAYACRGWVPYGYEVPGPFQPDPSPIYPADGNEMPADLPAEVQTCQDVVVYFSQYLLGGVWDAPDQIIDTHFSDWPNTTLFVALRNAHGNPDLYAHPWAVAEWACRVGPLA